MMKLLSRPLAVCCGAFVCSFAAAYLLSEYIGILILTVGTLSLLSVLLFAFCRKTKHGRSFFTLAVAGVFSVCAAMISFGYFVTHQNQIGEFYNAEVELEGICTSVESNSGFNATYAVRSESIGGADIRAGILLSSDDVRVEPGDRIRAVVTLRPLADAQPGYNEHEIYAGKGMVAAAEPCDGEHVEVLGRIDTVDTFLGRVRQSAVRRFDRVLDDRGAALFSAAFAGDRSLITDADALAVRRSGVSHLLAVSGMHFSVIMSVALVCFVSLGVPLKLRYALLSLIALAYIGLTGFSAPVLRCGIMLLFVYVGAVIGKRSDSSTSLLCSAAILLALRPYYLLSASFWLSFSATWGIVLIRPLLERFFSSRHRPMLGDIMRDERYTIPLRVLMLCRELACRSLVALPSAFVGALVVSVSAIAFSMPFAVLFFGNVSRASLVSGIILSPIVSVTLTIAPIVAVFGCFAPIGALGSALGEAFFTIADRISDVRGVYACVDYAEVRVLSLVFICLILATIAIFRKKLPALILCSVMIPAVLLTAGVCEREQFDSAQAVVSCTGGSDSMAFRSEDGLVITDMGSMSKTDVRECLSACAQLKENEISAYIFTRASGKQSTLVRYLLTNSRVDTVYMPDYASRNMSLLCDEAERVALTLGAEVRYFRFGEPFSVGEYTVCVSELEYLSRSVVPLYSVSVEHNDGNILWLSGAFFEGEKHPSVYGVSYDTVVLGTFGPKWKEELTGELGRVECSRYILGSEGLLEFVTSEGRLIGADESVEYTVSGYSRFSLGKRE